ncbi:hypothetical protein ACFOY2_48390 [Nonomuraea purpurea]|uniref:Uncharacterized protein n=1 Tax=Nonomuraea purpurea TaxID=1849276 RepID=A0ABV8GMF8_9ACTN
MSDVHEVTLALDLRDELSEGELADLCWHLGFGPQPETLSIVTEFPAMAFDEETDEWISVDRPESLLNQRGPAARVGGAVFSELFRRENPAGWAVTSRQELHPDQFDGVGELLCWMATKVHANHVNGDGSVTVGFIRFLEQAVPQPLKVNSDEVSWP